MKAKADVKRDRLMEIARERRTQATKYEDEEGEIVIRTKRQGGQQWTWAKLHIPCPVPIKTEFMELARVYRMTQAELGLVVVLAAIHGQWLEAVVKEHLETSARIDERELMASTELKASDKR